MLVKLSRDSVRQGIISSRAANPFCTATAATSDGPPTNEMAKLAMEFDRSGSGVRTSDAQSRDIHAINYTLSFHGRVLIDSADLALNYGQR